MASNRCLDSLEFQIKVLICMYRKLGSTSTYKKKNSEGQTVNDYMQSSGRK